MTRMTTEPCSSFSCAPRPPPKATRRSLLCVRGQPGDPRLAVACPPGARHSPPRRHLRWSRCAPPDRAPGRATARPGGRGRPAPARAAHPPARRNRPGTGPLPPRHPRGTYAVAEAIQQQPTELVLTGGEGGAILRDRGDDHGEVTLLHDDVRWAGQPLRLPQRLPPEARPVAPLCDQVRRLADQVDDVGILRVISDAQLALGLGQRGEVAGRRGGEDLQHNVGGFGVGR